MTFGLGQVLGIAFSNFSLGLSTSLLLYLLICRK